MIEAQSPVGRGSVLTSQERAGRTMLGCVFALWSAAECIRIVVNIFNPHISGVIIAAHCSRIAISIGLCYAIWIGQRWARRLTVAWCAASVLLLIWFLISHPTPLRIIFAPALVTIGLVLAFSKNVTAFMRYQRAQRPAWSPAARCVAILIGNGVIVAVIGAGGFFYVRARNDWPDSFRRRLAQLGADGVPITLVDCDRRYRNLGTTPAALEHFQRAFAAMSKGDPPLMEHVFFAAAKAPQHPLPKLSEMASQEEPAVVASYLQTNAEASRLLHEGLRYDRVPFPIKLSDGFRALLPHLTQCRRAAQLLALESVESAYAGDATKAAESILDCLHMAEILDDEPTLVGITTRGRIVAASCEALRTCLNVTPFRTEDFLTISERLNSVMAAGDKAARAALVTERCELLSMFQGSNREIADSLQQQKAGLDIWWTVEALRVLGILQRDAAFSLDCIDRTAIASANTSRQKMAAELRAIASDIESNQHLVAVDKKRVNVISCMILPGTLKGMQDHIWTQTLVDATLTALAVERCRQETGRLPQDLRALVPQYLQKIPEDPLLGEPLRYQLLPKGYVVISSASEKNSDTNGEHPTTKQRPEGNQIVFRVDR